MVHVLVVLFLEEVVCLLELVLRGIRHHSVEDTTDTEGVGNLGPLGS